MKWCNPLTPLTLQPEQSGGQGSIPDGVPPLERHDNGSRARAPLLDAIPVLEANNQQLMPSISYPSCVGTEDRKSPSDCAKKRHVLAEAWILRTRFGC